MRSTCCIIQLASTIYKQASEITAKDERKSGGGKEMNLVITAQRVGWIRTRMRETMHQNRTDGEVQAICRKECNAFKHAAKAIETRRMKDRVPNTSLRRRLRPIRLNLPSSNRRLLVSSRARLCRSERMPLAPLQGYPRVQSGRRKRKP